MRIGSVLTHVGEALFEGLLLSLLVVALIVGTAFAAGKGGGGTTSGGSGSCSANPNPVTVGADYTLVGTGLGAYTIVNVLISDSSSTTSWNLQADANGTSTLVWHSYWAGTTKVTYKKSSGRNKTTVVATCSFSVD
jgi:hypothetical protein